MKKILKDYFSFSKKERIAVLILLLLIGIFMALPYFFSVKGPLPEIDPAVRDFISRKKATVMRNPADSNGMMTEHLPDHTHDEKTGVLFSFNPNTISLEEWIKLGVKPGTANTILRYRAKGGKFRKPGDIRKIWGLSKQLADRLLPYVVVESNQRSQDHATGSGNGMITVKNLKPTPIEINTAGIGDWKTLPGIGDVLASRIVRYRERVNGFDSIGQLKKVYGLADSIFQQIAPELRSDPALLKKLNLNTATAWALSKRTGIPENAARAIVVYRQQYGVYKTVNDLRKLVVINDSLLNQIIPHIIVE